MSKRTFIPKWNPHRKPPVVRFGGRQRNVHALIDRSPPSKIAKSKEEDDGVVRWYNDPLARGIQQVSRITHERITQRVGLFRNAKRSQIVINDFSNNVKKACRRQISRLVASDDGRCDPEADASFHAAKNSGTHPPYREDTRSHQPCYRVEGRQEVVKELRNQPCSHRKDNDSGYQPRDIDKTWDAEAVYNEPWKYAPPSSAKPHQPLNRKSAAVSSPGQDPDAYSFPFEDECVPAWKQRRPSGISRTAQDLHQRLQTPEPRQLQAQHSNKKDLISNIFSLPDVSVRILSALPTIYLRDDYHEKYDNVAVRLLSESIKRSENEPGSTSNLSVYRSLMNRTTCISTGDQRSQPTDTACENIFQDCPNGFELLTGETSVTPELEKLFNRTVGASKLDGNPDFSRCTGSRSDHAALHRQISSLLTPTSLGSHKLMTAHSRPSNVTSEADPIDVSSWKFPFSRSPSSSESSADDIDFEWTIPEASHKEED